MRRSNGWINLNNHLIQDILFSDWTRPAMPMAARRVLMWSRRWLVCSHSTRVCWQVMIISLFDRLSISMNFMNPSLLSGAGGQEFKCHLELYLPSSSYGFSVFIEEMSLSGSSLSGCNEDYVQFGRDILFVTTHLR